MKSELEKKFDAVSKIYFEKFRQRYPLFMTDMNGLEYHIKEMQKCIDADKPAKNPKLRDGVCY